MCCNQLSRVVIHWTLLIISYYLLSSCFAQTIEHGNRRYCYHNKERIVTDPALINGPHGVILDFKYNETQLDSISKVNQLVSAAGCPKSIDGYPWIYHYGYHWMPSKSVQHENLCCYLAGSQGPCPVGQVLFVQSGSKYGICGCECLLSSSSSYQERNNRQQSYQLCYSKNVPQGQAYYKTDKTICYNLDEQGPCEKDQVLSKRWINNWSTEFISCLPVCNLNDVEWATKQINGFCTIPFQGFASGAGFSANVLENTNCPQDERHSVTLKRCLKRHPNLHLIIG